MDDTILLMVALAAALPYFVLTAMLLWKRPDGLRSAAAGVMLIVFSPYVLAFGLAILIVIIMALWWWAGDFQMDLDVRKAWANLRRRPPKGLVYLAAATVVWTICEMLYVDHLSKTMPGW